MSAEATGYVYRHSPYRGVTFQVHHAVADSVTDLHSNEFWMFQDTLAEKARCGRQAANDALVTLVADGFLELLERGGGRGKPSRFRFLFPDVDVVYDTRKLSSQATVSKVSSQATVSEEVSSETTDTPAELSSEATDSVVNLSSQPQETVVSGDSHRTQTYIKQRTKNRVELVSADSTSSRGSTGASQQPDVAPKQPKPQAQTLVAYFCDLVDASGVTMLKSSTAQVGATVKRALGLGVHPDDIRRAIEMTVNLRKPQSLQDNITKAQTARARATPPAIPAGAASQVARLRQQLSSGPRGGMSSVGELVKNMRGAVDGRQ